MVYHNSARALKKSSPMKFSTQILPFSISENAFCPLCILNNAFLLGIFAPASSTYSSCLDVAPSFWNIPRLNMFQDALLSSTPLHLIPEFISRINPTGWGKFWGALTEPTLFFASLLKVLEKENAEEIAVVLMDQKTGIGFISNREWLSLQNCAATFLYTDHLRCLRSVLKTQNI